MSDFNYNRGNNYRPRGGRYNNSRERNRFNEHKIYSQNNNHWPRHHHWQANSRRDFNVSNNGYNPLPHHQYQPQQMQGAVPLLQYPRIRPPLRFAPPPLSPPPGSEEARQRQTDKISALIKRQLERPEDTEFSLMTNEFSMNNSPNVEKIAADRFEKPHSYCAPKKMPSPKHAHAQAQAQKCLNYDKETILNKLTSHILNMSRDRMKTLVNAPATKYDIVFNHFYQQQRNLWSKALRTNNCEETESEEQNDIRNTIIHDIGIELEDLPTEMIAELSKTLEMDVEHIVDFSAQQFGLGGGGGAGNVGAGVGAQRQLRYERGGSSGSGNVSSNSFPPGGGDDDDNGVAIEPNNTWLGSDYPIFNNNAAAASSHTPLKIPAMSMNNAASGYSAYQTRTPTLATPPPFDSHTTAIFPPPSGAFKKQHQQLSLSAPAKDSSKATIALHPPPMPPLSLQYDHVDLHSLSEISESPQAYFMPSGHSNNFSNAKLFPPVQEMKMETIKNVTLPDCNASAFISVPKREIESGNAAGSYNYLQAGVKFQPPNLFHNNNMYSSNAAMYANNFTDKAVNVKINNVPHDVNVISDNSSNLISAGNVPDYKFQPVTESTPRIENSNALTCSNPNNVHSQVESQKEKVKLPTADFDISNISLPRVDDMKERAGPKQSEKIKSPPPCSNDGHRNSREKETCFQDPKRNASEHKNAQKSKCDKSDSHNSSSHRNEDPPTRSASVPERSPERTKTLKPLEDRLKMMQNITQSTKNTKYNNDSRHHSLDRPRSSSTDKARRVYKDQDGYLADGTRNTSMKAPLPLSGGKRKCARKKRHNSGQYSRNKHRVPQRSDDQADESVSNCCSPLEPEPNATAEVEKKSWRSLGERKYIPETPYENCDTDLDYELTDADSVVSLAISNKPHIKNENAVNENVRTSDHIDADGRIKLQDKLSAPSDELETSANANGSRILSDLITNDSDFPPLIHVPTDVLPSFMEENLKEVSETPSVQNVSSDFPLTLPNNAAVSESATGSFEPTAFAQNETSQDSQIIENAIAQQALIDNSAEPFDMLNMSNNSILLDNSENFKPNSTIDASVVTNDLNLNQSSLHNFESDSTCVITDTTINIIKEPISSMDLGPIEINGSDMNLKLPVELELQKMPEALPGSSNLLETKSARAENDGERRWSVSSSGNPHRSKERTRSDADSSTSRKHESHSKHESRRRDDKSKSSDKRSSTDRKHDKEHRTKRYSSVGVNTELEADGATDAKDQSVSKPSATPGNRKILKAKRKSIVSKLLDIDKKIEMLTKERQSLYNELIGGSESEDDIRSVSPAVVPKKLTNERKRKHSPDKQLDVDPKKCKAASKYGSQKNNAATQEKLDKKNDVVAKASYKNINKQKLSNEKKDEAPPKIPKEKAKRGRSTTRKLPAVADVINSKSDAGATITISKINSSMPIINFVDAAVDVIRKNIKKTEIFSNEQDKISKTTTKLIDKERSEEIPLSKTQLTPSLPMLKKRPGRKNSEALETMPIAKAKIDPNASLAKETKIKVLQTKPGSCKIPLTDLKIEVIDGSSQNTDIESKNENNENQNTSLPSKKETIKRGRGRPSLKAKKNQKSVKSEKLSDVTIPATCTTALPAKTKRRKSEVELLDPSEIFQDEPETDCSRIRSPTTRLRSRSRNSSVPNTTTESVKTEVSQENIDGPCEATVNNSVPQTKFKDDEDTLSVLAANRETAEDVHSDAATAVTLKVDLDFDLLDQVEGGEIIENDINNIISRIDCYISDENQCAKQLPGKKRKLLDSTSEHIATGENCEPSKKRSKVEKTETLEIEEIDDSHSNPAKIKSTAKKCVKRQRKDSCASRSSSRSVLSIDSNFRRAKSSEIDEESLSVVDGPVKPKKKLSTTSDDSKAKDSKRKTNTKCKSTDNLSSHKTVEVLEAERKLVNRQKRKAFPGIPVANVALCNTETEEDTFDMHSIVSSIYTDDDLDLILSILPCSVNLISYTVKDLLQLNLSIKKETIPKTPEEPSENPISLAVDTVEIKNEKVDPIYFYGHDKSILCIKCHKDMVIAGSTNGDAYLYDLKSGQLLHTFHGSEYAPQNEKALTSLCLNSTDSSSDSCMLFTGGLDANLRVYDIATCKIVNTTFVDAPIQCMEIAWNLIFLGSSRGDLFRYDIKKSTFSDKPGKVCDRNILTLIPTTEGGRRILLLATRNCPVSVRDAMSGLLLRTFEFDESPTVYSVVIRENVVFCGTSQHGILSYTFQNGEPKDKLNLDVKGVNCMGMIKHVLFAGCYNGNIYVYNTRTNKLITTLDGPGGMLLSMFIRDDTIIAGTKQELLKAWKIPQFIMDEVRREQHPPVLQKCLE